MMHFYPRNRCSQDSDPTSSSQVSLNPLWRPAAQQQLQFLSRSCSLCLCVFVCLRVCSTWAIMNTVSRWRDLWISMNLRAMSPWVYSIPGRVTLGELVFGEDLCRQSMVQAGWSVSGCEFRALSDGATPSTSSQFSCRGFANLPACCNHHVHWVEAVLPLV